MKKNPENDALWDLLGRVKPVQASPYFARKVLRTVRAENAPASPLAHLLRWLMPATAAATVAVAWMSYQTTEQDLRMAEFNAYFDNLAGLPSLVAQEDLSAWVETY